MKKFTFILISILISITNIRSQPDNEKIDSLHQEINILNEKIGQLKDEIQEEILKNGYSLPVKRQYSFQKSKVMLTDKQTGSVIDSISNGEIIRIIDKSISDFIVQYNGKEGKISIFDIDTKEHPALEFLVSSYYRKTENNGLSYSKSSSGSSNSSSGGSVSVKGYYRKDGTYVKSHTRSAPKRSSGRRR